MLSTTFRTCSRVLQRQRPLVVRYRVPHPQSLCNFSTEGENKTAAENKKKDSLRDTVNRLKNDGQNNTNSAGGTNDQQQQQQQQQVDDVFRWAADVWDRVKIEVDQTWHELVNAGKPKDINKKIHPVETEEGNREYTGPVEIMVIDESEHLTAWERMQRRLEESPIIQGTVYVVCTCVSFSCNQKKLVLALQKVRQVLGNRTRTCMTPPHSHSLLNRYNDEGTHCV
jgi:hypothetical protein